MWPGGGNGRLGQGLAELWGSCPPLLSPQGRLLISLCFPRLLYHGLPPRCTGLCGLKATQPRGHGLKAWPLETQITLLASELSQAFGMRWRVGHHGPPLQLSPNTLRMTGVGWGAWARRSSLLSPFNGATSHISFTFRPQLKDLLLCLSYTERAPHCSPTESCSCT